MYISNSYARQAYRLLCLLLCQLGIILQYVMVSRIGNPLILTCYFTILSNFACLFYFGYTMIYNPEKESPFVKGSVLLGILITGLVYHFMLNGAMEAGVGAVADVTLLDVLANTLVHYVVPIMTFVDYLLFTKKGDICWYHPFTWLAFPALYVIFIFIRPMFSDLMFAGFSGKSRYPYPFVDLDRYGLGKVLLMVAGISVLLLVLGFLLYGLDHLFKRMRKY